MNLVVGLGNHRSMDGGRYASTRHNAGSLSLEEYTRAHQSRLGSHWVLEKKLGADVFVSDSLSTCFVLPRQYMNLTGQAVQKCATLYKVRPERVLVMHDDLDLPLGDVKFKAGGSAKGHNGAKSCGAHLKTLAFPRLLVGIGRPNQAEMVKQYVLENFTTQEMYTLRDRTYLRSEELLEQWLSDPEEFWREAQAKQQPHERAATPTKRPQNRSNA